MKALKLTLTILMVAAEQSQISLVFARQTMTVRRRRSAALTSAVLTRQSVCTVVSSIETCARLVSSACPDAVSMICAATSSIATKPASQTPTARTRPRHAVRRATARTKSCAKATRASEIRAQTATNA